MPRAYQATKVATSAARESHSGNKNFFLLLGGLALLLGAVIVGLLLYVQSQQAPPPATTTVGTPETTVVTPSDNTTPSDTTVGPVSRDAQRLKDITTIQQALTAYYSDNRLYPQVVAGLPQKLLLTEPKDPLTAQPYIYGADLNGQSYHLQFILEGQTIFNDQVLAAGLHQMTPEGLSLTVVTPTTPVPPVATTPVVVTGDNKDTDNDGLTSAEEISFRTDVANPDTDGDGYQDGAEVLNLFSPISGQRAFLNVSGVVKLYKNPTFGYTMWLPQDWVYRSTDESNIEAVLTSPTGDSVLIMVEANSSNEGIEQWYTTKFGAATAKDARRLTVAKQPALASADGLSWYLTEGTNFYLVTYDPAVSGVINYPAVFSLLQQTFSFSADE